MSDFADELEVRVRVQVDGTHGRARRDDVVAHAMQDEDGAGVVADDLVEVEIVDFLDKGPADLCVEDAEPLGKLVGIGPCASDAVSYTHLDVYKRQRIKRRKETFACIDKAPLPSVGEFADPAAVIRAMRDERDAAYPELLTGAKQGEDA